MVKPVLLRARRKDISQAVMVVGDPARAEQVSTMLSEVKLVNSNRAYLTYTGYFDNTRVTIATHGIGGPSSAIVFEELRMLGARSIIRLGTCGAMSRKINVEEFVIPTGAAHTNGSLKGLLMDGVLPAIPDSHLATKLAEQCHSVGLVSHTGLIFSTDLFYNEHFEYKKWSMCGVLAIDMECATLFSLGLLRRFRAAALLIVTDSLAKRSKELITATELERAIMKASKVVLQVLSK